MTKALLDYSAKLEKMMVKLRSRVNELMPKDEPTPYPAYIHYRFFFEPELG